MSESWGLEPGDGIGPGLEVLRHLGGGVRNEVLLATDDRRLTTVVVKVLRPDHRDDRGLASLREEAQRLEAARHPSFPRLLDLVEGAERPHLVMEYVEGQRVSRLVRRHGPLAFEQLLPLVVELAGALHYLHTLGIVHLDVKPANLVLAERVRVIDLGLSRTFAQARNLRGRVGTLSWMAPEQHRPTEGHVGPAADVWAIGAAAIYCATGSWPLRELRREAGDDWEPTPEDVRAVRPPDALPGPLGDVVAACLAYHPDDRPEPAEIAHRVESLVDRVPRKPVLGRPRPTWSARR